MLNLERIRRHPAENILKAKYPVPVIARHLGICPSYLYSILNGTAVPGDALADRLNELINTINNNPETGFNDKQARPLRDVGPVVS